MFQRAVKDCVHNANVDTPGSLRWTATNALWAPIRRTTNLNLSGKAGFVPTAVTVKNGASLYGTGYRSRKVRGEVGP